MSYWTVTFNYDSGLVRYETTSDLFGTIYRELDNLWSKSLSRSENIRIRMQEERKDILVDIFEIETKGDKEDYYINADAFSLKIAITKSYKSQTKEEAEISRLKYKIFKFLAEKIEEPEEYVYITNQIDKLIEVYEDKLLKTESGE